jgi:CBS domain-containing protein
MVARDIMSRDVVTIRDDRSVEELIDLLVQEHIHGAPVLGESGELVGVVTQQDAFFATVTRGGKKKGKLLVRDLMTSPAVFAEEDTDIVSLCRLMRRLRIHRVPIVSRGKVVGIVSSLDVAGALADGSVQP